MPTCTQSNKIECNDPFCPVHAEETRKRGRDDLLPCGHEEWDCQLDCLSCLRYAVDALNNRLSVAEFRVSRLELSARQVVYARNEVLSVPQIVTKDYATLMRAVHELEQALRREPRAEGYPG